MSEINDQTDGVALLVNWFFCSPFSQYENLKVNKTLGLKDTSKNSREDNVMKLFSHFFFRNVYKLKFQHNFRLVNILQSLLAL